MLTLKRNQLFTFKDNKCVHPLLFTNPYLVWQEIGRSTNWGGVRLLAFNDSRPFNSSKMKQQRFFTLSMVILFLFLSSERWIPTVRAIPFQIPNYGRWLVPTIGEVWPKPQQQTSRDDFFILTPSTFHFEVILILYVHLIFNFLILSKKIRIFQGDWTRVWYDWRGVASLLQINILSGRN